MPYSANTPHVLRRAESFPELYEADEVPDPVEFANPPQTGLARWREVVSKAALVVALFYITYLAAGQFLS